MNNLKKVLSVLKKEWLDYVLLVFLSIALVMLGYSLSIIEWEINEIEPPESSVDSTEIRLVKGKNFYNGLTETDKK